MPSPEKKVHFIITFSLQFSLERVDLIDEIEVIMMFLGFKLQSFNVYFGAYSSKEKLYEELYKNLKVMHWLQEDIISIYYPKATTGRADISVYQLKSHSTTKLNPCPNAI